MLVSGVSRGGDEIKLIQYQKVTKLNAKIPSLFSCQTGGRMGIVFHQSLVYTTKYL